MRVCNLIEELNRFPPDTEIRLAQQPHWPFEYSIGNIEMVKAPEIVRRVDFDKMSEEDQRKVEERAENEEVVLLFGHEDEPEDIVYIGEGTQLGYLSGEASKALRWR